ncbi:MAG: CoA transferase, partial [Aldersonia sp.]|nr:CoA transferase [Aldersonia sp.]
MTESLFSGLKVIDCGSYIAAPAATTILADFGADVIKIEPPGAGDPYRHLPQGPGQPVSEHEYGWLIDARSKRGIALDLRQQEAQEVLHRLARTADVFLTNYPAKVRGRLRVDYDTLSTLNDRLIY